VGGSNSGEHGFTERLRLPAVALGDASIDVADLVLLALLIGSWEEFEQRVVRGLVLDALELPPIEPEEIRAAATYFRYGHNLVSANDFREWLGERSLRVADLVGVIRRRMLRERELERPTGGSSDIAGALWAEAVCGGVLRQLALAAADRLAAAYRLDDEAPDSVAVGLEEPTLELVMTCTATGLPGLGEGELRRRLRRLLALGEALERLRERVADDEAIQRCLSSHLLDWLQIGGDELVFDTEGSAREARLLIVDDALPIAEVAGRARVTVTPRQLVLDGAPAEASAALVACPPGEIAGPWLEEERWRLLAVAVKEPPSPQDEMMRERATAELLRDVLDRTLAGRVAWLQAL
jgi:hypothetical protein